MVDENRIIAEHSPATLGQRDSIPSDQRAFNVMVTGLGDETNVVVAPNKKTRDLQIDGKIEWITKEIARLQAVLSPVKDDDQTPDSKIAVIDRAIEAATSVVTVAKGRVTELEAKRLTIRKSAITATDRLKSVDERIKQFSILRSFYDTDSERIEATLEAGHAFERLPGGHCAVCGMMPDHVTSHSTDSIEAYVVAAQSELVKLEQLKTDLDDTLASLRSERTERESEIESLSVSLQQVDQEVAEILKPQVATSADQLKQMMNARAELVRLKDTQTALDRLRIEQM
jgi:DNA repair exonuclease SbcCD ATPase subunit